MPSAPHKTLRPDALLAAPPQDVGQIAAVFACAGNAPVESVRRAYELLEIIAEARVALETGQGYEHGLAHYEYLDHAYRTADFPKDITPRDAEGKRLPVPFDEAMAALMPRLKATDRLPRFRRWLQEAEQISLLQAGDRIAALRRDGIPPNVFTHARLTFDKWLKAETSEARAQAGRRSATARQGAKKIAVARKSA